MEIYFLIHESSVILSMQIALLTVNVRENQTKYAHILDMY